MLDNLFLIKIKFEIAKNHRKVKSVIQDNNRFPKKFSDCFVFYPFTRKTRVVFRFKSNFRNKKYAMKFLKRIVSEKYRPDSRIKYSVKKQ